jgi:PleD family two-component response regulator
MMMEPGGKVESRGAILAAHRVGFFCGKIANPDKSTNQKMTSTPTVSAIEAPPAGTATVLIVDDSRVSRLVARQYILTLQPGWTVIEAGTGEEALAKAPEAQPQLVLMDVNMPGMGGIRLCRKVAGIAAACPHLAADRQCAGCHPPPRRRNRRGLHGKADHAGTHRAAGCPGALR